jgi:lysozyme
LSILRQLLIRHEAVRLKPYLDTAGKITIGCGRNLDDLGISADEAMALLENDMHRVRVEASKAFPWFGALSPCRQDVVLSMLFNLGMGRFREFRAMLAALQKGQWNRAADEMLASRWASQVKGRAVELATMMRTDQNPQV